MLEPDNHISCILCLKINTKKPNLHYGGPLKIGCQLHGLRNILHMLKIMEPRPGTDLWAPEISLEALRHSLNPYVKF